MSPSLIEFADLGRFSNKCRVWNHYYFDLRLFDKSTDYDQRKPVLGHIGISETKGTMQLLKAFNETEISEHYKLVVLGDGPQLDSAKNYSKNRDLNVEFTGYVERSELPQQYNRMKLFINCSKSEGVPKAMFEAMACGTPVAATPVGGVPDYITDQENGFLLTSNKSEVLSEEIKKIIEQDEKEVVAERSRKYVYDNFSYQSTVNRYYEIVSEETTIDIPESADEPEEPITRI